MKTRVSVVLSALLMAAAPTWADCGFCGKEQKGEAPHSYAKVGQPAPDFTLKGIDGKEVKSADLTGKVVVLEWINHECPVVNRCHKTGIMKNTLARFKDKPVVWLAIDSSHFAQDKAENIREWAKKVGIDYAYLLDAAGKVGRNYEAMTTPHMFVIDQKGVLAYAGALDDDPDGKNEESRNYVAEAVEALLNGSTVATATTKSYGCNVKYKK